jgi:hypothetical protein
MRRSIRTGANTMIVGLVAVVTVATGCGDLPPPPADATAEAGGDRVHFYWATTLPDAARSDIWRRPLAGGGDVEHVGIVPLQAVTGLAVSSDGIIAGGVSPDDDLFWDAWVVPFDGGSPRRLAPIGNALVSVDASGALWTTITDFDASGNAAYEVRLSPSDGSPSRPLAPDALTVAVQDGADEPSTLVTASR